MRVLLSAVAMSAALVATDASAQFVNLTGRYRCVALCTPGLANQFAFITQNGTELNVVNDAGEASRAWVDYPGRIWVQQANEGAVYSPDGLTIQFDRGTIWQRALELPPPPPPQVALTDRGAVTIAAAPPAPQRIRNGRAGDPSVTNFGRAAAVTLGAVDYFAIDK